MLTTEQESEIYAQLSQSQDTKTFFTQGVELIHHYVEQTIVDLFRHDNPTMQAVSDSLLYHLGPLSEVNIRLKVLLVLGKIEQAVYEDIKLLFQLHQQLNLALPLLFSDDDIIGVMEQLHYQRVMSPPRITVLNPEIDGILFDIKQAYQQKQLRSYFTLCISYLCEQLT